MPRCRLAAGNGRDARAGLRARPVVAPDSGALLPVLNRGWRYERSSSAARQRTSPCLPRAPRPVARRLRSLLLRLFVELVEFPGNRFDGSIEIADFRFERVTRHMCAPHKISNALCDFAWLEIPCPYCRIVQSRCTSERRRRYAKTASESLKIAHSTSASASVSSRNPVKKPPEGGG